MKNRLQERLNRELETLVEELTVSIPARLGTAQQPNSYQALTERQTAINERLRHLRKLMMELPLVDVGSVFLDRAGFGSQVIVEDRNTKQRLSYTLMSGDVINLEAGEISIASPVGNALLGRRAGEEFEVMTPRGVRRLRVLDVITLFDARSEAGWTDVDGDTPEVLKAIA